ncbi:C-3 sterol dehydrogenase/C-4 decarboxylase family protein [Pyrenophora tritici-repentis]|uniref:3-beta hydroxysteroid dehydrogenase/isomerase protein n=1 Tax=Pyrenophora tritici-repentis TaxID=45151 RepID=A0A5M9LI90_9PLEO|nr:C-3 sterol dehydrogenase/C-4 decarboxylase family protein [Pyrenophora tritici-repentis]KAF7452220.1 C-3 sterol dehydrogenase/C-4 decarboxylase family protein [Pyrenophora tritici-repentis]KAI1518731.1 3-beta hydroxysteroid dehydrogenase/isomerase protein [Pyrenophora tritici-repentis]KAI1686306.1 3-beta hydroxysteroid dehydrogenase/isomerase protein [Pyrenophora tritici-repentis]
MAQTNILVTGGCGFIATSIISALLATKQYSITAIDINPPSLGSTTFTRSVRYVRCDILDISSLRSVFHEAQPAIVVHTVGAFTLGARRYSTRGQEFLFKVNVDGTKNVVEASKECGARGLVYTSSTTVVLDKLDCDFRNVDEMWPVGEVDTGYGLSKSIAETHTLTSSTPSFATTALRLAPTFGPSDTTIIPTIHACIATHQTSFILGTGKNLQDYVYVENVAHAHVLAVSNLLGPQTAAGEAFFITNGEPVTLRDFCCEVWKQFGHVPAWEVRVPEAVAWWAGWVAEGVDWVRGTEAL